MAETTISVSEFSSDKFALAAFLWLIAFGCLWLGRTFKPIRPWRSIDAKCKHLSRMQLQQLQFDGEIATTISSSTPVALIVMYSTLFTLKTLREHLYENAIDVFSVILMVQICALIIEIPYSDKSRAVGTLLTEHVPAVELAAVAIFTYVIWRTGVHWEKMAAWFHPSILDNVNKGMGLLEDD